MLTEELWQELAEGVSAGEYNLLLGAGLSMSALSKEGLSLPSAAQLANQISADFHLPEITSDLRDAYEAAQFTSVKLGINRDGYLKGKFSDCTPTWHSIIADMRWRSIWTLNIDDVIENVYNSNTNSKQNLVSLCWNSDSYNSRDSEVKLIHLHGYSKDPDIPRTSQQNFVFDNNQYSDALFARFPWHAIFNSEFKRLPFITIGTQLSYEFDLEGALSQGTTSFEQSGRHSFLIVKSISALKRMKFENRGIIVVEYDAEDFFRDLHSRVEIIDSKNKPFRTDAALRFITQFRQLRVDSAPVDQPDHDIFKGDNPTWKDAISGKIAPLSFVEKMMSFISSNINKDKSFAIYLEGSAGSGKTAALLDCCLQLVRSRQEVFVFRKEEELSWQSCLDFLQSRSKPPILIIDGVADFVEDFSKLYRHCEENNVVCRIIFTERSTRSSKIRDSYLYARTQRDIKIGKITYSDAQKIVRKLESFNRLGRLTQIPHNARIEHFTYQAGYQLFVGMYTVDYSEGFVDRIRGEYNEIHGIDRDLYVLTSIVYSTGHPMPMDVAERLTGRNGRDIIESTKNGGNLHTQIVIDAQGLKSRHRIIASQIIESIISKDELLEYVKRLLGVYSTYVTRGSVSTKNIYSLTFKSLMDADVLHDWLGMRAMEAYEYLSGFYSWSARFWEQRALLYNTLSYYSDAISYAHKAVSLKKDSYTYNTLGTVTLSKAISLANSGAEDVALELAKEAISYLLIARDEYDYDNRHPYTTFFTKVIELSKSSRKSSLELESEFDEWARKAKYSQMIRHEDLVNYIANFGRINSRNKREAVN